MLANHKSVPWLKRSLNCTVVSKTTPFCFLFMEWTGNYYVVFFCCCFFGRNVMMKTHLRRSCRLDVKTVSRSLCLFQTVWAGCLMWSLPELLALLAEWFVRICGMGPPTAGCTGLKDLWRKAERWLGDQQCPQGRCWTFAGFENVPQSRESYSDTRTTAKGLSVFIC